MIIKKEGGGVKFKHTGNSMDKMDGVSESAEMDEGPIEGVLAVGTMIDGYQYVSASPSLPCLSLKLWFCCRRGGQSRQIHLSPAVNFFLFLHRFHCPCFSVSSLCVKWKEK